MRALAGLTLAGGLLLCACGGVGKTVRRADDYMDAGRYTAAARTYTTALEKRPLDPELLEAVARAWLAAEDPASALAPAQLAAAAEAPGGRLAYAAALVGTGAAAKAQPLVESELGEQGESAEAEFLLAEVRLAAGDVQGAVSAVESGLPRNQSPRGTAFAAWVHHRANNDDRAVALARRAVDHVEADTQVFAEAAAVLLAAGETDDASNAASRARTAMREEGTLWLESAARRQETGDTEGAIRRLSWLGAVRPGDGMVPLQLAELWLVRKDAQIARAQLDLARQLKPFSTLVAQQ